MASRKLRTLNVSNSSESCGRREITKQAAATAPNCRDEQADAENRNLAEQRPLEEAASAQEELDSDWRTAGGPTRTTLRGKLSRGTRHVGTPQSCGVFPSGAQANAEGGERRKIWCFWQGEGKSNHLEICLFFSTSSVLSRNYFTRAGFARA